MFRAEHLPLVNSSLRKQPEQLRHLVNNSYLLLSLPLNLVQAVDPDTHFGP